MARRLTNVRNFGQKLAGGRLSGGGLLPGGAKLGVNPPSGGAGAAKFSPTAQKGGTGDLVINSRPAKGR